MQCRDARELADSFLTGQLLVETNHEVVRHLEECPACRAEFAARRAMREGLRAAMEGAGDLRPRPELASELRARLQPPQTGISRRSVLSSWWAVAAAVAMAATGGLFIRDSRARTRLTALARVAAGDHQNCAVQFNLAERPIPLEDAGRRFGAPYAALATFDIVGIDGAIEVVDRHACVYGGRRFGHVVFRYQGRLVSLLVTEGAPPSAPQLEPRGDGPEVAALPAGHYVAFVVADLEPPQVLHLAETLSRPLSQHLGT